MKSSNATLHAPPFVYPPREFSLVWRLAKGSRTARCALWTHPIGAELRVYIDKKLLRCEAARDVVVLIDRSIGWRGQFQEKGWA